jgi:glycosyltransferase involved in cell wall biosynthesis
MRVAMLTFYPILDGAGDGARPNEARIPGGIRMVAYNLVNALREVPGLELHVIHCHADIGEDVADGERTVRDGPVTLHYLPLSRQRVVPNLIRGVRRLVSALRELQPDLVHAHAGHFAYAGVAAGYPTIYTIHGILPYELQVYNRTLFDRLRYGLLNQYERRALRRVDALVAISPAVHEAYAAIERPERWVRINNPVPDAFLTLADRSEPWRVLYVGSITEVKDLLTLVRAVARVKESCPQVRLRVAGRATSTDYERRVHALVRERGMEEQVAFLGLLDRGQLLDEYTRATLVALPSLYENAPMAIIEAMAAAKPVVATAVGGVPHLVRVPPPPPPEGPTESSLLEKGLSLDLREVEGEGGSTGLLVPAQDDAAMAEALLTLLRDPALARRMGERAREEARQRFGAASIAQETYALYQRVLDASAGGSR